MSNDSQEAPPLLLFSSIKGHIKVPGSLWIMIAQRGKINFTEIRESSFELLINAVRCPRVPHDAADSYFAAVVCNVRSAAITGFLATARAQNDGNNSSSFLMTRHIHLIFLPPSRYLSKTSHFCRVKECSPAHGTKWVGLTKVTEHRTSSAYTSVHSGIFL